MRSAKFGDTVKICYIGKLEDGSVFDTCQEPFEFAIGREQVLPGLEKAVVGMKPGEEKTVTLPPEEAFGPNREELIIRVNRENLPYELKPKPGQQLEMRPQNNGRKILVTVADVSESNVIIDANHPLADENVVFEVELLDILN